MRAKKNPFSKLLTILTSLLTILFVLAPAKIEGNDASGPSGPPLMRIAIEDPFHFLEEFAFLPGSAVVIEDRYVLTLYEHAEKNLYALAVFTANCDAERCAIRELIAYSIFDAQGEGIQLANQPTDQLPLASANRRL